MKEFMALFVVYIIYFAFSILLFRKAVLIRSSWFYVGALVYMVLIYFYFELVNFIHILLRERGFFLEFGHASISLILLMLFCYFTSVVLIIFAFIKRRRKTQV